jgi:hypothetical protein
LSILRWIVPTFVGAVVFAYGADTTGTSISRPVDIVDRYLSAVQNQQLHPADVSMQVDIDAKLPKLKKQGRLHALRQISKLGKIRYLLPIFEGDNTIKKDVIGRYLQAETQAKSEYAGSLAISPENYKFKYKGTSDYAGRTAYVFHVSPRKRRVGLFKGELWIDSETYLPLREWGEFVKNPSVFLKNVYFVRDYFIYNGFSVPRRLISDVDTRLVGRAELTVWFDDFKFGDTTDSGTVQTSGLQKAPEPQASAGGIQAR